jgi:uncharacterized membrane protein
MLLSFSGLTTYKGGLIAYVYPLLPWYSYTKSKYNRLVHYRTQIKTFLLALTFSLLALAMGLALSLIPQHSQTNFGSDKVMLAFIAVLSTG